MPQHDGTSLPWERYSSLFPPASFRPVRLSVATAIFAADKRG